MSQRGMVKMDLFLIFNVHEKLRNGHPKFRVDNLGSNFAERDKDELSIRHLGVRDTQVFFL